MSKVPDNPVQPSAASQSVAASADAARLHRERMASLGTITAGIAHELNNPISYIGSNLDTLRRYVEVASSLMAQAGSLIAPEQRASWQQALDAARWPVISADLKAVVDETMQGVEHVKQVVGELKMMARTSIAPEQGSVDACVSSALTVLTHQLKQHCQVEVNLACQHHVLMVRSQITQLVINLVCNAAEAVAAGGRVRVSSHSQEGLVTLVVEDDGPGVPPNQWQEVFQPFSTTKPGGTGLGLSIVMRIARNHGGEVRLDHSADLGGARFTVELRHWQGVGSTT